MYSCLHLPCTASGDQQINSRSFNNPPFKSTSCHLLNPANSALILALLLIVLATALTSGTVSAIRLPSHPVVSYIFFFLPFLHRLPLPSLSI